MRDGHSKLGKKKIDHEGNQWMEHLTFDDASDLFNGNG